MVFFWRKDLKSFNTKKRLILWMFSKYNFSLSFSNYKNHNKDYIIKDKITRKG